jgi:hypothetical protein
VTRCTPMASMPEKRMGLPPRSLAADAHDCIMVRSRCRIYRIQGRGARSLRSTLWQARLRSFRLSLRSLQRIKRLHLAWGFQEALGNLLCPLSRGRAARDSPLATLNGRGCFRSKCAEPAARPQTTVDHALIRGLGTAATVIRLGLPMSTVGHRSTSATKISTGAPHRWPHRRLCARYVCEFVDTPSFIFYQFGRPTTLVVWLCSATAMAALLPRWRRVSRPLPRLRGAEGGGARWPLPAGGSGCRRALTRAASVAGCTIAGDDTTRSG